MKTRLFATATAAATATALLGFTGAAQAFSFGTNGISFNKDTWLNFTFKENNGWFDSTLGIYEVLSDGSTKEVQTLLGEEEESRADFQFLAGRIYTLGLTNYNPNTGQKLGPIRYSTNSLNEGKYQQTVFGSSGGPEGQLLADAGSYTSGNPLAARTRISFEDSGMKWGADGDYNDFVVEAAPEPLTLGGMVLGGSGLLAARRRRQRKQA